ncbi:MAG: hypothetical protein QOE61_638 [Micromonosporaceae bacterium]|nr:hypothetical protein [Micromonosporaceae bacterium]
MVEFTERFQPGIERIPSSEVLQIAASRGLDVAYSQLSAQLRIGFRIGRGAAATISSHFRTEYLGTSRGWLLAFLGFLQGMVMSESRIGDFPNG